MADKNSGRIYLQVAYLLSDKKVIEREFGNLARIRDHYPKKVISLDDGYLGSKNGIEHVTAWDFMTERTETAGRRRIAQID